MNIQTKYVGQVEVNEEEIINFMNGLPGFSEETRFTILDLPGNAVFQILQSTNTPSLAFVITNPYHFYREYTFEIDTNTKESLVIESEKDIAVFSIVTLQDPFEDSTMNLKAPIIINPTSKRGKQFILNQEDYSTKMAIAPINSSAVRGE
ncbi:flagellar assembly protein FliW [Virgibacillus flavescens]|uniref:flagellar assembly protein FliW n=1 Tax=Virgibacillus flavescens TaxID=1611422 RepID=UPI003D33248B